MDSTIESGHKARVIYNQNPNVMPIPNPQAGEKQSDFIQRCMEAIASEYTDKDQAVAVCYTQWKEGK
jgi:hypothetical protein